MEAFFASLGLVALSELGDKTMLVVLALAGHGRSREVFFGTMLAVLLLFGGAVFLGEVALRLLPGEYIAYGSGALFLIIGIFSLVIVLRHREEKEKVKKKPSGSKFWSAFALFAVAELGDKTQLATVGLTAEFNSPWMVFFGAVVGELIIVLLSVMLGKLIARHIPMRLINLICSLLFIAIGGYIILSSALQFTIF